MKKLTVIALIALVAMVFSYCTHAKKAAGAPVAAAGKVTYETDLKPLIAGKCAPCHMPASGGNKKAYDNYSAVKGDIDDMLHRIALNPGEHGYMPSRKPKLNDSTIQVFKQWKADGLLEK
jgi:cytochrome c553